MCGIICAFVCPFVWEVGGGVRWDDVGCLVALLCVLFYSLPYLFSCLIYPLFVFRVCLMFVRFFVLFRYVLFVI